MEEEGEEEEGGEVDNKTKGQRDIKVGQSVRWMRHVSVDGWGVGEFRGMR